MSTATESVASEAKNEATAITYTDGVVSDVTGFNALSLDAQLAIVGKPADGKVWMRVDRPIGKGLLADTTGAVLTKDRKKSTGRNKPKKPQFAISGKLTSAVTAGFDVEKHAKLKETDFTDPLDFAKWEIWYFDQKKDAAQKRHDNLAALGSTPEERKAAKDNAKLLNGLDDLVKSCENNPELKAKLTERFGDLFAKLSG